MIELELADTDANQARDRLQDMCEKLLANTVIENYDIRQRHGVTIHACSGNCVSRIKL